MRIASLVPSATEMLFALGLGDAVVAVTHECDFPPEVEGRARLTRSVIPEGLPPGEVDAAVREVTGQGRALYELDETLLARLGVDLIVTQALCAVCAVSYDDVRAVAERLPGRPDVISLDPETLEEVLDDIATLGAATGAEREAGALRTELERRLDAVRRSVERAERPRVAALEWLDPPFAGGHWVPEMIELAGGVDVLGTPGHKSRTVEWDEIAAAHPDVVVTMPCGLYVDEAFEQALGYRDRLEAVGAPRIVAVDAAASFSRPGPRLVEGTELLAHLLHPERADAPPGVAWRPVAAAPVG
jgi:iron complex transport system substrate-binding protein